MTSGEATPASPKAVATASPFVHQPSCVAKTGRPLRMAAISVRRRAERGRSDWGTATVLRGGPTSPTSRRDRREL
jgi:hypothetical protein